MHATLPSLLDSYGYVVLFLLVALESLGIPLRPPAERARPVVPSPAAVEYLRVGEAGHRVRVPVEVQPYSSGVKGGLVGGAAMAVVALFYGLLAQGSLWYPINLLAGGGIPPL